VRDELHRLGVLSASAFLDAAFESEPLKTALGADAMAGGMAPGDAGSSLLLAWRAAQEMCGSQGAVAAVKGGPAALANVLLAAAQGVGVEIRTGAPVARLNLAGAAVSGVVLASGEEIAAPLVLSSLARKRTLLELAPAGAAGLATASDLRRQTDGVGQGWLVFALSAVPGFAASQPGARFVIAERLDDGAYAEARAGLVPDELVLEAVVPTAFDATLAPAGRHLLWVRVLPLPVLPGWPALTPKLADKVLAILERQAPGLTGSVVAQGFVEPSGCRFDAAHITASWRVRIETPIEGLLLCGQDAEPVPSLSGRAARIAAAMGAARLKGGAL